MPFLTLACEQKNKAINDFVNKIDAILCNNDVRAI